MRGEVNCSSIENLGASSGFFCQPVQARIIQEEELELRECLEHLRI